MMGCAVRQALGRVAHKPPSEPPHSCTLDKHFCFWAVKMRGMSEAVWEMGECHNPTVNEYDEHSLTLCGAQCVKFSATARVHLAGGVMTQDVSFMLTFVNQLWPCRFIM